MNERNEQAENFSTLVKYSNKFFSFLLYSEDMISLYTCRKILRSSSFIHKNITAYLSEENAVKSIFISVNFAILIYQYIFSTWFMYYLTTYSGLKKLYQVIIQNPLLSIFFYLSFYLCLLGETDRAKFNYIAEKFNLTLHQDLTISKNITSISEGLAENMSEGLDRVIAGNMFNIKFNIRGYKGVLTTVIRKGISEQIILNLGKKSLRKLLYYIIYGQAKELEVLRNAAVYIDVVETEADMKEWNDFIDTHIREIKKDINKQRLTNREKNLRLQQVVEKRTDKGEVLCLDKCKPRVKTSMGCYCESDCGPTYFLAKKSWCYVDPKKCKKGKYLPTYFKKSYDTCDSKNVTRPKCFTGVKYKDCINK